VTKLAFAPATREATYARIALSGPSGSGKTYTALTLAAALSDTFAVIDTERGSASKYVGLNGWKFDTVTPQSFSPVSLVELLGVAAGQGYGCIVVDSLSHYWSGVDGMLEQADKHAVRGNTFAGWKEAKPAERRMVDALVSYPGHIIVTMRSKTEYVIEENEKGKKAPVKIGLKPDQRDGIEYEFDVVGDMDLSNTLSVVKSRIPELSRAKVPTPGTDFAAVIKAWCEGAPVPTVADYRSRALAAATDDALRDLWNEVHRNRLASAPCVDEDGNPTVLGEFIKGKALRVQAAAAKADSAKPAQDTAAEAVPNA
jgi:hypothetical protein